MQAQDRGPPPKRGQKEAPTGQPGCLYGLKFVLTGVLDSLDKDEAGDLIKMYGGQVTGSVSSKTNYLVAGTDAGPAKTKKAEEHGIKIIDEDGLFEMIRSRPGNSAVTGDAGSASKAPNAAKKAVQAFAAAHPAPAKPVQSAAGSNGAAASASVPALPSVQRATGAPAPAAAANNALWVDKYAPKTAQELVGNPTLIKNLGDWLRGWHSVHRPGAPPPKPQFGGPGAGGGRHGFGPQAKAALLSGPPGVGKSSAAKIVARSLGFSVIEFNASDARSKGALKDHVEQVTNTRTFGATASLEKSVLIMDEVDGMSGGDRGGSAELIVILKKSRIPIICICNDVSSTKVRTLRNYCYDLPFRKPTAQQVAGRLLAVAQYEGVATDLPSMQKLCEGTNGDIRQALHLLQLWFANSRSLTYKDVQANLDTAFKDVAIGPFDAARTLLDGYAGSTMKPFQRMEMYFVDSSLVPLMVQEGYVHTSNDIELVAEAAACISEGDLCDNLLRRGGGWSLMPNHAMLSSVLPCLITKGSTHMATFPAWLGNYSKGTRRARLLSDLSLRTRGKTSGDNTGLLLDYAPALKHALFLPLVRQGADGVQDAVSTMSDYGLLRDDWESVHELASLGELHNWFAAVDSKVKAAFTRTVNQAHIHVQGVRVGDVGMGVAAAGAGRAAAEGGDDGDNTAAARDDDPEADETQANDAEDGGAASTLIKEKKKPRAAAGAKAGGASKAPKAGGAKKKAAAGKS